MTALSMLWLPILISTVAVFIVSAITHMFVPYRRTEWAPAPEQETLQNAFRSSKPGLYLFPTPADVKDRRQPKAMKAWAEGPSAFITLIPRGPLNMGRNLGLSFLLNLFVSLIAARIAWPLLGPAPREHAIIHLIGAIGFMSYAIGPVYESIWYWKPWKSVAMFAVDAVLYGVVMAATFAWLWPR